MVITRLSPKDISAIRENHIYDPIEGGIGQLRADLEALFGYSPELAAKAAGTILDTSISAEEAAGALEMAGLDRLTLSQVKKERAAAGVVTPVHARAQGGIFQMGAENTPGKPTDMRQDIPNTYLEGPEFTPGAFQESRIGFQNEGEDVFMAGDQWEYDNPVSAGDEVIPVDQAVEAGWYEEGRAGPEEFNVAFREPDARINQMVVGGGAPPPPGGRRGGVLDGLGIAAGATILTTLIGSELNKEYTLAKTQPLEHQTTPTLVIERGAHQTSTATDTSTTTADTTGLRDSAMRRQRRPSKMGPNMLSNHVGANQQLHGDNSLAYRRDISGLRVFMGGNCGAGSANAAHQNRIDAAPLTFHKLNTVPVQRMALPGSVPVGDDFGNIVFSRSRAAAGESAARKKRGVSKLWF